MTILVQQYTLIGWETVETHDSLREARQALREYREHMSNYRHRLLLVQEEK